MWKKKKAPMTVRRVCQYPLWRVWNKKYQDKGKRGKLDTRRSLCVNERPMPKLFTRSSLQVSKPSKNALCSS